MPPITHPSMISALEFILSVTPRPPPAGNYEVWSCAGGWSSQHYDSVAHFMATLKALATVNLIASILCDLTISVSLVYFLNKLRSGFRSINVGLLTSAIATATLITYFVIPDLTFAGLHAIGAKIYVNSVLVSYVVLIPFMDSFDPMRRLNSRVKARQILDVEQEIPLMDLQALTQGEDLLLTTTYVHGLTSSPEITPAILPDGPTVLDSCLRIQ
ncbi:hypothetical protein DXG01_001124 [Tephrocybe rancida]|nr:hypothetical protein DXG01_001124 [Tephrocybe rancida]